MARWLTLTAAVLMAAGLAGLIAGCSGGSGSVAGPVAQGLKISEYVGDGHGGTKPWPSLLPLVAGPVQPAATPEVVGNNDACLTGSVAAGWVNWYALEPRSGGTDWIVTLQPTANADSDLYLMEAYGGGYDDGAACRGYSNRSPDGGNRDRVKGSYAPDWVHMGIMAIGEPTTPPAYIAVYGSSADDLAKPYTLEADAAGRLTVDGAASAGSLNAGNSRWFSFSALVGHDYVVTLSAVSGDPDLYIYQDASTKYVTGSAAHGGATLSLRATATVAHFMRVYAYNDCKYSIKVTSP